MKAILGFLADGKTLMIKVEANEKMFDRMLKIYNKVEICTITKESHPEYKNMLNMLATDDFDDWKEKVIKEMAKLVADGSGPFDYHTAYINGMNAKRCAEKLLDLDEDPT